MTDEEAQAEYDSTPELRELLSRATKSLTVARLTEEYHRSKAADDGRRWRRDQVPGTRPCH